MQKLGFIGAGSIGASLISGLIKDGYPPHLIYASNIHPEILGHLANQFQIHVDVNNAVIAEACEVLIFTVKPTVLPKIAKQVSEVVNRRRPLVISVVAGIREKNLQNWLQVALPIVRCMPNTPALVGSAASALFANQLVSQAQKELAESILRAVGVCVWLNDEAQLDTVTALSGSGPAYFFYLMECLQNAAIAQGLSVEDARLLTQQTALGAARMALENTQDVKVLRQHVTSKGGTTEAGLKVLDAHRFAQMMAEVIAAAKQRSIEIANEMGQQV